MLLMEQLEMPYVGGHRCGEVCVTQDRKQGKIVAASIGCQGLQIEGPLFSSFLWRAFSDSGWL